MNYMATQQAQYKEVYCGKAGERGTGVSGLSEPRGQREKETDIGEKGVQGRGNRQRDRQRVQEREKLVAEGLCLAHLVYLAQVLTKDFVRTLRAGQLSCLHTPITLPAWGMRPTHSRMGCSIPGNNQDGRTWRDGSVAKVAESIVSLSVGIYLILLSSRENSEFSF